MMLRTVGLATLLLAPVALAGCGADEDATTANETLEDPTPVIAEVDTPDPVPAADAPAPEFGTIGEVGFAATLWSALEAAALVGDQPLHAPFYEGAEPHGFVLETIFAEISVSGTVAPVVVKRNYGPEGVTVGEVANDPATHLAAITVMYQRPGFNSATNDWFWAKYLPDGTLDLAGETPMAGNVAGCIGCHDNAPGDDWLFVTDRIMAEPYRANEGPQDALADPDNCRPGDNDCTFGG